MGYQARLRKARKDKRIALLESGIQNTAGGVIATKAEKKVLRKPRNA